jgi:hypothetical protein
MGRFGLGRHGGPAASPANSEPAAPGHRCLPPGRRSGRAAGPGWSSAVGVAGQTRSAEPEACAARSRDSDSSARRPEPPRARPEPPRARPAPTVAPQPAEDDGRSDDSDRGAGGWEMSSPGRAGVAGLGTWTRLLCSLHGRDRVTAYLGGEGPGAVPWRRRRHHDSGRVVLCGPGPGGCRGGSIRRGMGDLVRQFALDSGAEPHQGALHSRERGARAGRDGLWGRGGGVARHILVCLRTGVSRNSHATLL